MQRLRELADAHLPAMAALIERTLSSHLGADSGLVETTRYQWQTGGKRLRALLPLLVAETLGHDPKRLIPFGAACELLHNATLVHDDLQDGDRIRRGQPAVWVEFGAARAINLGDAMLYGTLLCLEALEHSLKARHDAWARVARETLRVVGGQELEFALQSMDRPSIADYTRMVEGKTSGLFSLPLAGAAALCGAPTALVSALERAARELGVLFQIQDDVLDLFGDKGRAEPGSDLGEGKISYLVAHALAHAPSERSAWLRRALRADRDALTPEIVERSRALFREHGALEAALAEIDRRSALARDAIADHAQLAQLVDELARTFLRPIEGVSL